MDRQFVSDGAAALSCRICLDEIPVSEACCPEAVDYVLHYCGIDCYGVWLREAESQGSDPGRN